MSERHLGQTLGKYRIDELIGSGGFAWVYKAFDPELEIHVALKVLKPQFAGDETFEQRFRREAATAAKLRHPNIIKIYSVGRDGEAVYFAMDYYPSGLADRLEVASTLPEEFVVRVGVDVAQALGYAHREGVIHRDIKVDNILFDAHGNAVVADFGIARALTGYSGQTGTNMVVGTPQYFAPEQARAKPLDGRADIYSLGVTLYRAATGRLPFEGDDWYEIARQHVEEPPPPPRTVNPDLSPEFEAAILHCLEKQPDDRPATGELLAQELVTLLPVSIETSAYRTRITGSEPTVVVRTDSHPTLPPATDAQPPARSRAAAVWIGASVVVAAIALAIPALRRLQKPEPTATAAVGDSGVAVTPAIPPAIVDSPGTDTTARRDSVRQAPARTSGTLEVKAPAGATISIGAREVGSGSWSSDTLHAGSYELFASVPAPSNCPTALVKKQVVVRAGRKTTASLEPRSCGGIYITSAERGARWTLTPVAAADTVAPRRGTTFPVRITVPVGDYLRVIQREKCFPYSDTAFVRANQIDSVGPIRLVCAPSH